MKFYNVVLFIFLLNVSLALMQELQMMPGAQGHYTADEAWMATVKEAGMNDSAFVTTGNAGLDAFAQMWMGTTKALGIFVTVFVGATVNVHGTMIHLMCPVSTADCPMAGVAMLITIIVYMIYVTGMIQILMNRNVKAME